MIRVTIKPLGWAVLGASVVASAALIATSMRVPPAGSSTPSARASSDHAFSSTVTYNTVPGDSDAVKTAADADDTRGPLRLIGKSGTIRGFVRSISSTSSQSSVHFGHGSARTVSAVIAERDYSVFPDPVRLAGQEVLVTGIVVRHGSEYAIQIVSPDQIVVIARHHL